MRKTILTPLLAVSMLTACASGGPPMPAPRLPAPASLSEPCPDLPQPASGQLPDLLANHVETARRYHLCRERQRGLTEWIEATDALR